MCLKSVNPLISAAEQSVIRRTSRQQLRELRSLVRAAPITDSGRLKCPCFSTKHQNSMCVFLPHLTRIMCKGVLDVCSNLVGHSSYATLDLSSNVACSCAKWRINSNVG